MRHLTDLHKFQNGSYVSDEGVRVVYPGPTRSERGVRPRQCARLQHPFMDRNFKNTDFEDTLISNVLRDLAFIQN